MTTTTLDPNVETLNEAKVLLALAAQSETAALEGSRRQSVRASMPGGAVVSVHSDASLEPCGGTDYPPCYVAQRESGGSYTAYNPAGCGGRSCGGKWQFDPRTWNNFGGYPEAQLAPPAVQDEKARELWDGGRGCAHWDAC